MEEKQVLLTLSDGQKITIPRENPNQLRVEMVDTLMCDFGFTNSQSVSYRIVNGKEPVKVLVETTDGVTATVQKGNRLSGSITLAFSPSEATSGLLIVRAYDSERHEASAIVILTQKKQKETPTISDDPTPISFADPAVRTALLGLCDSNGDGKISYAEASRVPDLGTLFQNNRNIKSFDELQHFTSLKEIPNSAFSGCLRLTSVVIPKGVRSINEKAFSDCVRLTSVVIPESVTSISHSAFRSCNSLTSVKIPEGVTSIGREAFNGCSSLTSVVILEGVTSIASQTFNYCSSLTSVVIPESVTSIGYSAFNGCSSLTSVVIPESVTSMEDSAFDGCSSLTSVVMPRGITSVPRFTFKNCSGLTSVVIPEGVRSIATQAFNSCSSLSSVVIPEGVRSIGDYVFYNCPRLISLTLPSTLERIDLPLGVDPSCVITVPKGYTEKYRRWFSENKIVEAEE